jgi:hypothetical protein
MILTFNNFDSRWVTGSDGDVWVWVMGEHPKDLSIEQILENESKDKARRLAEKEAILCIKFKKN